MLMPRVLTALIGAALLLGRDLFWQSAISIYCAGHRYPRNAGILFAWQRAPAIPAIRKLDLS